MCSTISSVIIKKSTTQRLFGYGGTPFKVEGKCNLARSYKGTQGQHHFYAVSTQAPPIGLVLNEQGTGYQYSMLIEILKNLAPHLKEHPKISTFAKFESYWFKIEGIVPF